MSKVLDLLQHAFDGSAAECGVEVIDMEYKKGANGMELTVFIDCDKEGGVSLNDCEKFHRAIDVVLDELDPTEGAAYQLSVSSPGLDRPLKTERDYKKHLGKEVSVSLFNKVSDLKKFVGILKAYDLENNVITIEYVKNKKAEIIELDLKNIALIKPEIKFE